MSHSTIKSIQPPPELDMAKFAGEYPELARWIRLLAGASPLIHTFNPTLTPASVSANSESNQTFTVAGLKTNDVVLVNKPSNQSSLSLLDAYVSATDTLSLKYRNFSGGAIVPTSEAYRIVSVRL